MSFRSILKSNPLIRRVGKRINIFRAFYYDAKNFSKYYVEEAEENGDYRYSIMLLVHSLEKGMCMPNPRPFGFDKVKELIRLLDSCTDYNQFEYKLGLSALFSWTEFFEAHNWQSEKLYSIVKNYLVDKDKTYNPGSQSYAHEPKADDALNYEKLIFSRHSVRDYKDIPIRAEDLELALKAFAETPTACNRQMCRLIAVKSSKIKETLNKVVIGLPGFNKEHVNFFIITYDLAAFAYSGERQQGLFNAGLCTMNFVNALHVNGIGSCCLQWSNKYSEDVEVRKLLELRDSERIGIVIGAGYYLEENTIPCSVRRPVEELYREV